MCATERNVKKPNTVGRPLQGSCQYQEPTPFPFVAAESVWADRPGNQGTKPEQTHIHAMGGKKTNPCGNGYESREEAKAGTKKYIKDQLEKYDKAHKWWAPWSGSSYLGNAYHATEDSYASGHNYQPWTGGFPSVRHIIGDLVPSGPSFRGAYNTRGGGGLAP
jgi:hypothetical protein